MTWIFDVHNTCNTILTWTTPVNIALAVLIMLYGFFNNVRFDNDFPGWRSTFISSVVFAIIAEVFIWLWQLALMAFMFAMLMLILQGLFLFDFLRHSKSQLTDDRLFVWLIRIELILATILVITDILFSYTAIVITF